MQVWAQIVHLENEKKPGVVETFVKNLLYKLLTNDKKSLSSCLAEQASPANLLWSSNCQIMPVGHFLLALPTTCLLKGNQ